MVLMMIFTCRLGTSGLNDAQDLEKSMDLFLVSMDLHALESSDLGKGAKVDVMEEARRDRRWSE